MTSGRLLLRKEFEPSHAQLEFGEIGGTYPDWGFGSEPVVANEEKIVVATLPDFEGRVVLEVWLVEGREQPHSEGVLVHDGILRLSREDAEAGTYLGGDLERVRIGRGQHRVRVLVDEPGYAKKIVCLVEPAETA